MRKRLLVAGVALVVAAAGLELAAVSQRGRKPAAAPHAAPARPVAASFDVTVDPRVEVIGLIFHLAGNPEYNMGQVPSYERDVAEHFGRFQDHPAAKLAAELRNTRGVSFDAPMSLAVHLKEGYSLEPRAPLDPLPPGFDERWRPEDVKQFLEAARAFVKDTGFREFMEAHRPLYQTATSRLEETLKAKAHLEWFDRFFGPRPGRRFHVVVAMLHGGGNYGPHFRQGKEEDVYAIQGVWQLDEKGEPLFDEGTVETMVHEFGHSYVNPIVDAHLGEFEKAGKKLFAQSQDIMAQQAYGQWQTVVRESVLRACQTRYALAYRGEEAAKQAVASEAQRGFTWVGPLSQTLGEYERNRKQYRSFEDFVPPLAACLDGCAAKTKQQGSGAEQDQGTDR